MALEFDEPFLDKLKQRACGQAREPISISLIGPVIDRFRDDLYRIADIYPELGESC